MRVVNDRRKLPRVALNGGAILYSPRGQFQCACIDVSAGGMAVMAMTVGRVKERVRIHAQLAGFPLLTDALVVRARQTQNGYLWGLRFLRLDRTTKSNLEQFVRQQLASVARLRQAQLYAERLRGMGLPLGSPAPAFAIEATLDHSAPQQRGSAWDPAGPGIEVPEHYEAPPPVVSQRQFDVDRERHYTPPVAFPAISGEEQDPLLFDPGVSHNTQAEHMLTPSEQQELQDRATPQYGQPPPQHQPYQHDPQYSQYPQPQQHYEQPSQHPQLQQHYEQPSQYHAYQGEDHEHYPTYDPYPAQVQGEEKVWEIDDADLEMEPDTLEVEEPRYPTPGYEDEMPEIEPDRPPVLPPTLQIVDFDEQTAATEVDEDETFEAVPEPDLYAGVPSPDLHPDDMPTPPMGTTFPGRPEPDLYAADGLRLPTPASAFDRLAELRRDEDVESPYLGDIQASTSDLTPTDAKMRMTDEVWDPQTERVGPSPAPVAVDPTTPVSVWPEERTPHDTNPDRPLPADRSTQIPTRPSESHRTNPGFAVLPDFDYEPEPVAPGEQPARTGETVVADPRTYRWPPVGADLSGPQPMPAPGPDASAAPPPPSPQGYAVVPLLDTERASVSGFTIVAPDEELQERSRMSVGSPEFDGGARPVLDEAMTSMYTPLPEYPDQEDTDTTLHPRNLSAKGRTISPEEGLRLSMPGAAVVPAPPGPAQRRSTDLAGAGPCLLPVLNRRPPPAPGPAHEPSTKHTYVDIAGRPAPPPRRESTGEGINGSKRVPATRGSGTVARPKKGNRPGLENATTRAFPVVPPLATDPNVRGEGKQVARPPAAAKGPPATQQPEQSGQHPVAARSGQHPVAGRSSTPGENGRLPPSLVPTGSHQPVGPAPPSRIPTSPHDVPVGVCSPRSQKRQLIEDALAQLRARTAEKRKQRVDTGAQEEIERPPRRKRRGVPLEDGGDPQLADLFRAAIKDLERAREE